MATKDKCAVVFKNAIFKNEKPTKGNTMCKTHNSKIIRDGNVIKYKLHQCDIVTVDRDNMVARLSNCGYSTKTTKDHLNLALSELGKGKPIKQKNFEWKYNDKPFKDGMEIKF